MKNYEKLVGISAKNLFFFWRKSRRCMCSQMLIRWSVASVGLVSLGAATDGVTPILPEKSTTFLVSAVYKVITLALAVVSSPLQPFDLVCLIVLSKFSQIHSVVTPWRVSPGLVRHYHPLVTPLKLIPGATKQVSLFGNLRSPLSTSVSLNSSEEFGHNLHTCKVQVSEENFRKRCH